MFIYVLNSATELYNAVKVDSPNTYKGPFIRYQGNEEVIKSIVSPKIYPSPLLCKSENKTSSMQVHEKYLSSIGTYNNILLLSQQIPRPILPLDI